MPWTTIVYTILIILLSYIIYKLAKSTRNYIYLRSLPGPPIPSLLRGNSFPLQESNNDLNQTLEFRKKWISKYPKLCRFAIGPMIQVLCSDPESVKAIFNENFPKHSTYKLIQDWIGDGLLTSKGDKWFRHRKLLTPAFHYQILDGFFAVYSECVDVMLDLWAIQSADHVVLQEWIPYLTLDIILQCICSVKTDCQIKREQLQYVQDVASLTRITILRFRQPVKYYYDFIFNRSQLGREFIEVRQRARQFTYEIILARKRQLENGDSGQNSKYRDFLDILLHASDPTLTDEEIRDEVDTFVFEGHDTTATALTWTLYLLAKHTNYQDMCRQEVFKFLDGNSSITKSTITSLIFLPMCIKESLRLYPPVINISRCPAKPSTVAGHKLPAGLLTTIGIYQMHNHSDIWDNPSEFNPYRFSEDNIDKIVPFSYIPFSACSRNCIGQIMALHELNYVIARIITRFNLALPKDSPEEIEFQMNILLKPKLPLRIDISPI
ncbi:Cytochrome P450 4B1-like [Oopsacas minuta]|uniref:Cytochrome P450 4B1-like n=1 Tax=Oopsacas minuta TaxID=111878 RepID=A0AAV7KJX5_9METZ|nr:Cytochrome P450 4B1-like [Oopsacas minuta]